MVSKLHDVVEHLDLYTAELGKAGHTHRLILHEHAMPNNVLHSQKI